MSQAIFIFPNEALAIKAKRLLRGGGVSAKMTAITDSTDGCRKGLIIGEGDIILSVRMLREGGIEYTLGRI